METRGNILYIVWNTIRSERGLGLCTFQYGIISDTLGTWEQPFRFSSIMAFFISWISFFNSSISCFASLFFSLICFWLSSMISFISKIHWFGRSSTVWYMPSETYKKQNYPEYWNTSFIIFLNCSLEEGKLNYHYVFVYCFFAANICDWE